MRKHKLSWKGVRIHAVIRLHSVNCVMQSNDGGGDDDDDDDDDDDKYRLK